MEIYLKTLKLLNSLLLANNEPFWAEWMQKDIDAWNQEQSTEHHLNAFGGAGSFNDINLGQTEKIGYWKNALLSNLASISYGFAKNKTIEYRQGQFLQLDGAMCRKCKNGDITENTIERILANKFIPLFIENLLSTDNFQDLLNLENLSNSTEIEKEKCEIIIAIENAKISIKPFDTPWAYNCNKCGEPDKISYRWDIIGEKEALSVIPSSDNLEI